MKKDEPSLYMDFSVIEASLENSKESLAADKELLNKVQGMDPNINDQEEAIFIQNANYDALLHKNYLD